MPLTPHIDFLTEFASSHFTGDETRDDMLRLKIDHSLRVFDNAKRILRDEGIKGVIAKTGSLAALYHDIGRFPQFAQYATFNDRESVNHGRIGVLTLRALKLPDGTTADEWQTIRLAVAQHNVKSIRDTLPEPVRAITKLVRDADKIDILKVMVEHFSGENPDPAITHGFDEIPGQYSDRIYNAVVSRQNADYADIRCANDFKLLITGWVYDLNYPSSINLLNEQGLIERIFSFLPKDSKIQSLEKMINKFMRYKGATSS